MVLCHKEGNKEGRFHSSLRRGYVLLLTHISTVVKNNSKTSNSDDIIGNSNPPHINVLTKISLNKLVTLIKETDTESSTTVNDKISDDNNTS